MGSFQYLLATGLMPGAHALIAWMKPTSCLGILRRRRSRFCVETNRCDGHHDEDLRPVQEMPARLPLVVGLHSPAAGAPEGFTMKTCLWCHLEVSATTRRDAMYCSKRCRQAAHRFGRHLVATTRAEAPLRLAVADPPYPGLSRRYYKDHPDYAGEVDHRVLLSRLAGYDGWALATSSTSLQIVLGICSELGISPLVASWTRGSRHSRSSHPLQAWEAVVYMPARAVVEAAQVDDALVYKAGVRLTDPARVVGAKPSAWISWVFQLLGPPGRPSGRPLPRVRRSRARLGAAVAQVLRRHVARRRRRRVAGVLARRVTSWRARRTAHGSRGRSLKAQ
jgi:hypothetical protein